MDIKKRDEHTYEYRNQHIVVTWEARLCEHARECVTNLPNVFNSRARPWIKLSKAEPEEIARVVALCPSGAIKYEWPTSVPSDSDEASETSASSKPAS